MQKLLTILDKNLIYDGHEIVNGNFIIRAHSNNPVCKCIYCGRESGLRQLQLNEISTNRRNAVFFCQIFSLIVLHVLHLYGIILCEGGCLI